MLEQGLAEMETIEHLGIDRKTFTDIDLFGLDKLLLICEYLQPIYGRCL